MLDSRSGFIVDSSSISSVRIIDDLLSGYSLKLLRTFIKAMTIYFASDYIKRYLQRVKQSFGRLS